MISLDVQALREQRQEKLDSAEALYNVAKAEDRDMSTDEVAQADAFMAEHDQLVKQEKRATAFQAARADLNRQNNPQPDPEIVNQLTNAVKKPPTKPTSYSSRSLYAFRGQDADKEAHNVGQSILATCSTERHVQEKAQQYCRDNGLIRADGQTLDDDAKGGYLGVTSVDRAIIRIVEEVGIAPKVCRRVTMPAETHTFYKRTGGLTVYSPEELGDITGSEMSFGNVSLVAKDRATLTLISRKALRSGSTIASIADEVVTEIGYAFADQLDDEFVDGDGTSTYFNVVGIEGSIGSAGITTGTTTSEDTWAEMDLTNFTDLMGTLPAKYWRGEPVWLMSPAFYFSVCVKLMAAAGGNTFTAIQAGSRQTVMAGLGNAMFLGYPVLFTGKLPVATAVSTVQCLFGNFRDAVVLGERDGVEVAESEHRYFEKNAVGIRGLISYDLNVHEGGDASNAGAYVAWKTGAAS